MRALVGLCLIAGMGFGVCAIAQTPPVAPESSVPTLKVNPRLTLENVTVTDSNGQPVRGLTEADFTVKEDGKPQAIKNFAEYGAAKPAEQTALPPNVYSNRPQVAEAGAVNILMLDNVSTGINNGLKMSPDYFMVARQQAVKYLEKMAPGTEMAVLDLADGLRVAQGFTADKSLLIAAANSVATTMVPRTYLPSIGPPPPGAACLVANTQSELTVQALNQAAAFLSGIKGRKNLIWFTPGIPWVTDYAKYSGVTCLRDYTRELHQAYDRLTAAQVALYPIDPRGLMEELSLLSDDYASLQDMAKATGGVAYFSRNDMDAAMGEAIATGSDYYSISYVPPLKKYDGQHHSIKVSVDRPGVRLSYREGYNSDDSAHPAKDTEKKDLAADSGSPRRALAISMGREAPTLSDVQFDVRIEPDAKSSPPPVIGTLDPKLKSKPLTRYDFHYMIPADHVRIADAPNGGHQSALILDVAAYDGDGKLLTVVSQPASLPLTQEAYQHVPAVTLRCVQQIDLPAGQLFLRVGILDTAADRIGTLDVPLKVVSRN